jgi:hypothetical protein
MLQHEDTRKAVCLANKTLEIVVLDIFTLLRMDGEGIINFAFDFFNRLRTFFSILFSLCAKNFVKI